jgi:hypothetical protein
MVKHTRLDLPYMSMYKQMMVLYSSIPEQLQNIFISVISNQGLFPPGEGIANAETIDRYHQAKKIPHNQYITLFVNKDGALLCAPKHICESN